MSRLISTHRSAASSPLEGAVAGDHDEDTIPFGIELPSELPEFVVGQWPWVVSLDSWQADTCRRITLESAIPHRVVEDPTRNTPNECRAVAGDRVRANSAAHACTSDGLMETSGRRPNVFAIWLPTAPRILSRTAR